ncbi:unnamed protein product [Effrenium voratum]|uniref:Uncharacterized protein n=1 Tax=Effrenium voratum TaxID=2562239 RepID=A0AA36IZN8_9DINO|nr:unnamed protein product [Effrenium voratum]
MSFFWQLPEKEVEADLPDPGAEVEEKLIQEAAAKRPGLLALAEDHEPSVQWPPVKPLPPAEGDRKSGRTRGGRDRDRRRRGGEKAEEAKEPKAEDRPKKREDGWLPKAEYEAKKREERAQRRNEAGKGKAGFKGEEGKGFKGKGFKGDHSQADKPTDRGSRGGRGARAWEDLPPRPPPPEETSEAKARRQREDAELTTRDKLRNATTVVEMQEAIATAKELGLKLEASVGERKLQRMQGA